MKYIRHYSVEKNKEVVIITDEGEYPIWNKDFDKSFSTLATGDEIENAELLVTLAIRREIKKKALRRLSAGDVTRLELKRKLAREKVFGNYADSEWIDELLTKLENAGYIDDKGYALRFAQKCLDKFWGEIKIRGTMREKGFSSEHIDAALEQLAPDYVGMAMELIEKRFDNCDKETSYRKLYQRGFTSEAIIEALDKTERT